VLLDAVPISTSFNNTKATSCHCPIAMFVITATRIAWVNTNTSLHTIWNSYRLRFIDYCRQMNRVKSRAVTVYIFLNKFPPLNGIFSNNRAPTKR
jgi:hypothetical protein